MAPAVLQARLPFYGVHQGAGTKMGPKSPIFPGDIAREWGVWGSRTHPNALVVPEKRSQSEGGVLNYRTRKRG